MHHVDFKKRQKFYLRILSYSLITFLTITTTAILLYAALGYRIGSSGHVVRSGLLLINSRPTTAEVYINGENKNDPTSSRFVLPAGKYSLGLKQDGYRAWSKTVLLEPSGVENLYYPILVPTSLKSKPLTKLGKPDVVSQSPNRKLVFLYKNDSTANPQLIELDPATPNLSNLVLPEFALGATNSLDALKVIEWSQDSSHLLIEQTVDGAKRLLSVNVDSPEKTINITAKLGGVQLSDVHYAGADVERVYGISKGVVSLFSLNDGKSKPLVDGIRSYYPIGDQGVSFVRGNKANGRLEAGLIKNDKLVVVHSIKSTGPKASGVTVYNNYDNNEYLSVRLDGEKKVTVSRNPLNDPILKTQLPYTSFNIKASSLSPSSDGRFILARDGQRLVSYDLEYSRKYSFNVSEGVGEIAWLDSNHLIYKDKEKSSFMRDFDGANTYELLSSDYGQLMFSSDLETSYRLVESDPKAQLESISMVVPN